MDYKFRKPKQGMKKGKDKQIRGTFNPYQGKSDCVPKTNNSPKTKY